MHRGVRIGLYRLKIEENKLIICICAQLYHGDITYLHNLDKFKKHKTINTSKTVKTFIQHWMKLLTVLKCQLFSTF